MAKNKAAAPEPAKGRADNAGRPSGPPVLIIKLYPTVTRERHPKTGRLVLKRQHPLPSSNEYYRLKHSGRVYSKDKTHFRNKAIDMDIAIKTAATIAVRQALDEAGLFAPPALAQAFCMVKIYYPDKTRRDQHNTVYKAAFDAFKNCGVWQDDDRVELYMPLPAISRHNPRIEFHIYALEQSELYEEPVPANWQWDEAELIDLNGTYLT
jgi:Holliday junction resolvase RusA-like endonuclease